MEMRYFNPRIDRFVTSSFLFILSLHSLFPPHSKASFNQLRVVGQFNLGFIIARHKRELFIIDQHASDEKYRFEQLCESHRFRSQPLVMSVSQCCVCERLFDRFFKLLIVAMRRRGGGVIPGKGGNYYSAQPKKDRI